MVLNINVNFQIPRNGSPTFDKLYFGAHAYRCMYQSYFLSLDLKTSSSFIKFFVVETLWYKVYMKMLEPQKKCCVVKRQKKRVVNKF